MKKKANIAKLTNVKSIISLKKYRKTNEIAKF